MQTKEQKAQYRREYELKNRDRLRKYRRDWVRKKNGTDPKNLKENVQARDEEVERMIQESVKNINIKIAEKTERLALIFGLSKECITSLFQVWDLTDEVPKMDGRLVPCAIRRYIYARDNYTCQYCGKDGSIKTKDTPHGDLLTIDHKNPIRRFGIDSNVNNLITACSRCNARKHNKTYEEYVSIKV